MYQSVVHFLRCHGGPHRRRRGALLVLIAVCLPIFVMMAAFAINVAYMHLARAELRIATDAAARAAGRTLSRTQSKAAAIAAAEEAAAHNLVAGRPLRLAREDIEFGMNTRANLSSPWVFTPDVFGAVNAVRVTGRKTRGGPSSPVPLFLVHALGREWKPYFEPVRSSVAMQIDRDIILVVDRSGSMTWAPDRRTRARVRRRWIRDPKTHRRRLVYNCISGTKWNALADAVEVFLDTLEQTVPEEHVALASFNHTATRDVELTGDYDRVRAAMDEHTHTLSGGGTNIPAGFAKGLDQVLNEMAARPYAQKTIILMTDGVGGDPRRAVERAARKYHIAINTITFGSDSNERLMAQTAKLGGGRHWHATDRATLLEAYQEIAEDIPTVLTQ